MPDASRNVRFVPVRNIGAYYTTIKNQFKLEEKMTFFGVSYSSDWFPLVPFSGAAGGIGVWKGERKRFFFDGVVAGAGAEWRFWLRRFFLLLPTFLPLDVCLKKFDNNKKKEETN